MTIEAFVAKWTCPTSLQCSIKLSVNSELRSNCHTRSHLLEIFAVLLAKRRLIFADQFLLLLGAVHPEAAWTHEIRAYSTLGTCTDDFVVKLFRLSPLANALETEAVIAIRQNTKPLLTTILLPHDLKADATGFLFGLLHEKSDLHLLLMDCYALGVVLLALLLVGRIETISPTQLTHFTVSVAT